MSTKIQDSLKVGDSRFDRYWQEEGFSEFYRQFRRGVKLPKSYTGIANSSEKVIKKYHLKGFQFGNWLTNDDRYNYIAAFFVCAYDLNKILKFKNSNIGLDGRLGVAFGARGYKGAVAHYESNTRVINITRYKKYIKDFFGNVIPVPKESKFKLTGGVGAVAHEYGHFLDYVFGSDFETHSSVYSLTNGRSTNRNRIKYTASKKLRNTAEDILELAYWKNPAKKVKSNYIKRIEEFTDKDYFFRRNEIFARLFEQYIGYKLSRIGIKNEFLTFTKYNEKIYLKPSELKAVAPLFDELIKEMRTYF